MAGRRGRRVYTIGHSSRGLGEFIGLLKRYGVGVVVDVRRFPSSRRVPWFSRERLQQELEGRGIAYVWLGSLLGGFRPKGYESYTGTEEYWRGIRMLVEIVESSEKPVAVMCRERLWRRCHRRYIADTLTALGYRVIHIIDLGYTEEHPVRRASPRG